MSSRKEAIKIRKDSNIFAKSVAYQWVIFFPGRQVGQQSQFASLHLHSSRSRSCKVFEILIMAPIAK